mmetsp:Transcript_6562/g.10548  ORF Transcript_6562/g.10548 Transcript_6562/m.10548 type:complete len:140 (-) Transcript_6562:49-468(-)|eukprot:CAMPEP_0170494816 /NCGR_PEP_ID=MMETSP0208-20121228/14853_1 /TAXON_ID=197538 /ORGANISM="Strombidium inclinatum, Strain S3" /LENGTH=139 /DNA_ID=CAMNT_0010770917 /DNA_START=638 /DNA_END=1057 /DNA_ORIENTATION=-
MLMLRETPACPRIKIVTVDVRDCAEAHLKALTVPEAAGKRFILNARALWFSEMGQILKDKYGSAYNVPTSDMPYCVAWFGSLFRDDMKLMVKMWNIDLEIDPIQTREVLGIEFTDLKKSILDMAESMIDCGYLPDKRKK